MKLFLSILSICFAQTLFGSVSPEESFQDSYSFAREAAYFEEIITSDWQIQLKNNQWQNIVFPFSFSDTSEIRIKTTFSRPTKLDSIPVQLTINGISGVASIYVNNRIMAVHPNEAGPLVLELPPNSLRKENQILIILQHTISTTNGFPKYAWLCSGKPFLGMSLPLRIRALKPSPVYDFSVKITKLDAKAHLEYSYKLHLPDAKYKFRIDETFRPVGFKKTRFISNRDKVVKGRMAIPLSHLWSPDNPIFLHINILVSGTKSIPYNYQYKVGLRSLEILNKNIVINRQPIQIRGINYHKDIQKYDNDVIGSAIREDFSTIKKLGFNAVRFPHHIPDIEMMYLADSLGLLLFGELPIFRYPAPLFFDDDLLENAKKIILNLKNITKSHPSLIALGLAQEISLSDAATQKFLVILKKTTQSRLDLLTYVSPIPTQRLPIENAADFYLFDIYGSLHRYPAESILGLDNYFLAGKIGLGCNEPLADWDANPSLQQRQKYIKREFDALFNVFNFRGGFIESFKDWQMAIPNSLSILKDANKFTSTSGLFNTHNEAKYWLFDFNPLWQNESHELLADKQTRRYTNFFSLIVIFATIIFFTIYRKQPRMRENLRKSLRHPYGFFVDLRERRIIPLFNSFWVGSFAALQLTILLSSIIFYYQGSYLFQEIAAHILIPLGLYETFLRVILSPVKITSVFFLLLLLYPILVGFLLKIISTITQNRIRFRQGLAIGLWAGMPLLFLLPFSLFSFQILTFEKFNSLFSILLFIVLIWTHFRIINGIRVLFITKIVKVLAAVVLSYIVPIVIFWAVYKPSTYWLDYLDLLIQARSLF